MPSVVDELDDAARATRSFLLPIDRGRWLRLALIAFFVGGIGGAGGGGGGNVPASDPDTGTGLPGVDGLPGLPGPDAGGALPGPLPNAGTLLLFAAVVVGLLVLLVLGYALVGAVLEFVLVDGLVAREVRLRGPFRRRFREGLRLFGFRLGVGLLVLGGGAAAVGVTVLAGVGVSVTFLVLLIPLLLVGLALGLVVLVVLTLTTDLVVPTMVATDRGVLGAWRRLAPVLRARWTQVGLYLVVRLVLGVAAAIAVSLLGLLAAAVVAVPFLVVGGVVFLALSAAGAGPVVTAVLVVGLGLLFLLALLVAFALVQVPVVTFFRYYALFVHGFLAPELDLVGELRGDDGSEEPDGLGDPDGPGNAGSDDAGEDR